MRIGPGILGPSAALAVALLGSGAAAEEDFKALVKRLQKEKPEFAKRQQELLAERYDLCRPSGRRASTMARGKPVQEGVRVKLPQGMTWEQLAAMSPEEIKNKNLWPAGFYPAAASAPRSGRHDLPEAADRRDQEADRPRPDALRSRLRPAAASAARVPGADLPDHAARPGRRVEGPARHAGQLQRAVQRHPESRSSSKACGCWSRRSRRRSSTPPTTAARLHGPPGRGLLRLPRQRPHQRRHAHRRRHPPERAPPPHRHAVAARREHPAAVRLAARHEDRRGLHRVRAARRLLRRRSRAGAAARA